MMWLSEEDIKIIIDSIATKHYISILYIILNNYYYVPNRLGSTLRL